MGLREVFVHKKMRQQSIGSLILRWIEKELKPSSDEWIFLECGIGNQYAQKFFKHHGYKTCSNVMVKKRFF